MTRPATRLFGIYKMLLIGLGASLAVGTAACGKKKKKVTVLEGTWVNCTSNGDTPTTYSQSKDVYAALTITSTSGTFTDAACSTVATTGTATSSTGTFVIGDKTTTPAGATAMNTTMSKVTITPIDATTASTLTALFTCTPAVTLTAGTTTDVSTCKLAASGNALNGTNYNIVQITGGTTLLYGDESAAATDGSTSAKQPTALDTKTVYTKQ